jgi:hypothetical protein
MYWTNGLGLELTGCEITDNTGGLRTGAATPVSITSCYFHDNTGYAYYVTTSPTPVIITGTTWGNAQNIMIGNSAVVLTLNGYNKLQNTITGSGTVVISSGAIVDMTGNTNANVIACSSGVSVLGDCTVINSVETSVTISGGTYATIKKDGTTT